MLSLYYIALMQLVHIITFRIPIGDINHVNYAYVIGELLHSLGAEYFSNISSLGYFSTHVNRNNRCINIYFNPHNCQYWLFIQLSIPEPRVIKYESVRNPVIILLVDSWKCSSSIQPVDARKP